MFHFLRRFAFKERPVEPPELEPGDAPSFNKRGVRHIQEARPAQARADFDAALEHDPNFAPALMNIGNLAFDGGDAIEAVRWYEAAIAADAEYAMAHMNLASAYKKLGRYDDAVRAMHQARRLEGRRGKKQSRLL
ncbi:MAG TPA: tetratricopeptide repeat protein [Candidatus Aquilonibacter sp.]|nr:tetratricopeptide repeat protein [Candidatus Aquilonibacter sp.]